MRSLACRGMGLLLATNLWGCLADPPGGASDVSCIEPIWEVELNRFLLRYEDMAAGKLLMTVQSHDDFESDIEDGVDDFVPHQEVYRFDAASEEYAIVPNAVWDVAESPVNACCGSIFEDEPLTHADGRLLFHDQVVPVSGGVAVDVAYAPTSPVAAVLSTSGRVGIFGTTTGQNFHQLFSLETGRPIGPALRLPTGGADNGRTGAGWPVDDRFVLYRESLGRRPNAPANLGILCIVPVAEHLAELKQAP